MANDHHQYHSGGAAGASHGHSSKKHSRKHRIAVPPVPHASPSLLQQRATAQPSSTSSSSAIEPTAVPIVDPEALPAKQGLNEWGAFSGSGGIGDSGFGFGPLLFHNHADGGTMSSGTKATSSSTVRADVEAVEMDRLMLNDPLSFNPLAAISWAKLDDEEQPTKERGDVRPRATKSSGRTGAKSRQDSRGEKRKGVEHLEAPAPSPSVGSMSQTFSAVSLQTPDPANDGIQYAAPPSSFAPPSTNIASTSSRQQRKHRHRSTKTSHAPAPETYQAGYAPALAPTSGSFQQQPMASPAFTAQHHHQQQQQQQQQQHQQPYTAVTYTQAPRQDRGGPLFACPGPYCSAAFATDTQLSAHYRAEHSLACSWASCGASGFTSNNALVWHVKAEHLLLCPVPGCCDRVFANRKQLDGHVRVS